MGEAVVASRQQMAEDNAIACCPCPPTCADMLLASEQVPAIGQNRVGAGGTSCS